jgi:hypothetical protein
VLNHIEHADQIELRTEGMLVGVAAHQARAVPATGQTKAFVEGVHADDDVPGAALMKVAKHVTVPAADLENSAAGKRARDLRGEGREDPVAGVKPEMVVFDTEELVKIGWIESRLGGLAGS